VVAEMVQRGRMPAAKEAAAAMIAQGQATAVALVGLELVKCAAPQLLLPMYSFQQISACMHACASVCASSHGNLCRWVRPLHLEAMICVTARSGAGGTSEEFVGWHCRGLMK
jgi:hypothetical protein